jgi:hypothetical protein
LEKEEMRKELEEATKKIENIIKTKLTMRNKGKSMKNVILGKSFGGNSGKRRSESSRKLDLSFRRPKQ